LKGLLVEENICPNKVWRRFRRAVRAIVGLGLGETLTRTELFVRSLINIIETKFLGYAFRGEVPVADNPKFLEKFIVAELRC
jgi:hypothetical protein